MNFTVVCEPLAKRFGVPSSDVPDFLQFDYGSQQHHRRLFVGCHGKGHCGADRC